MTAMFVFIETKLFTRLADELLPDDELWRLQTYLNDYAEAGDIIRGSGGVRKLRWAATGRGKRGGLRIIYYLRSTQGEIWLLTLYAKNEAQSISGPVLKKIKEEIDDQ
jgi:hypothetical protein